MTITIGRLHITFNREPIAGDKQVRIWKQEQLLKSVELDRQHAWEKANAQTLGIFLR